MSVAPDRIATAAQRLLKAETAMHAAPDDTKAAIHYAHVLTEWGEVGGYDAEAFWDECTLEGGRAQARRDRRPPAGHVLRR